MPRTFRHLSEELDEKSETAEQLKEENQRLLQRNSILQEEVATLRLAMQVISEAQSRRPHTLVAKAAGTSSLRGGGRNTPPRYADHVCVRVA